jgi:hypothetical protein
MGGRQREEGGSTWEGRGRLARLRAPAGGRVPEGWRSGSCGGEGGGGGGALTVEEGRRSGTCGLWRRAAAPFRGCLRPVALFSFFARQRANRYAGRRELRYRAIQSGRLPDCVQAHTKG